ncbi:MAG: aminopeptidase P family protein [Bacteroidetes bacterium]|nr:aminopeptidase P family protein [Bacteroidota bacterium]
MDAKSRLIEAEQKAAQLFATAEDRGLITPGKTERQLNEEMFDLAKELFGIEKYWHKRIIRSGPNTLQPYNENPPDLTILADDILFFDFGPIFEDWEADFGRTYVIGNDPVKQKLKNDIETAWDEGKAWFHQQTRLTGAEFYEYAVDLAKKYGWTYGGEIAGHLIGQFPHERLEKGNYGLYVHPENHNDMFELDAAGNPRNWILEIHFVDKERQIGGFFEQLLT